MTIFLYIFRQSMFHFLWVLLGVAGLIAIINTLDAARDTISGAIIISLIKLPGLLDKTLVFIVLISTVATLVRLHRFREWTVLRAHGQSVWQLLRPLGAFTLVVCLLRFLILQPLIMTTSESEHLASLKQANIHQDQGKLWMRQKNADGYFIIHGMIGENGTLSHAVVMTFKENGGLSSRLIATKMLLKQGYWHIPTAQILDDTGQPPRAVLDYRLPSSPHLSSIWNNAFAPETLSIPDLWRRILVLRDNNTPSLRLEQHFYGLLATPLLFLSVVLLSLVFTSGMQPRSSLLPVMILCLGSGFLLYFLYNISTALGLGGQISPPLAAGFMPCFTILTSMLWLLYAEES
jgi:lipopolysaccharide export system permease protein